MSIALCSVSARRVSPPQPLSPSRSHRRRELENERSEQHFAAYQKRHRESVLAEHRRAQPLSRAVLSSCGEGSSLEMVLLDAKTRVPRPFGDAASASAAVTSYDIVAALDPLGLYEKLG